MMVNKLKVNKLKQKTLDTKEDLHPVIHWNKMHRDIYQRSIAVSECYLI